MRMLRKTATLAVAAALGGGAAIGVSACGEDREGDVQFENGTGTETTGTAGTETTGTEATGTEATEATGTEATETTGTETAP
jgi:hypothetical protein